MFHSGFFLINLAHIIAFSNSPFARRPPGSGGKLGASRLVRKASTMGSSELGRPLIWIDLEMTGLDPDVHHIIEAACIITDHHANIIAETPNLIIHQPLNVLQSMNEWCLENHTKSGLFKASLESDLTLGKAEEELLTFVQKHTPPGVCPLAGNTVYMDKYFLLKHMPRFCQHLHYRILDVSSIKIVAGNWYNVCPPKKDFKHRALDDIKESIEELKYYFQRVFKPVPSSSAQETTAQS